MMRTTHAFHPAGFDHLERREVLSYFGFFIAPSVLPIHRAPAIVATVHATVPPATAVTAMQNIGAPLTDIYLAFENGASASALAASFPTVSFQGNMVGVSLRARTSATTLASELQNLGASIVATSTANLAVEAYVPVSQLLAVAQLNQTLYGSAMLKPVFSSPIRYGGLFR